MDRLQCNQDYLRTADITIIRCWQSAKAEGLWHCLQDGALWFLHGEKFIDTKKLKYKEKPLHNLFMMTCYLMNLPFLRKKEEKKPLTTFAITFRMNQQRQTILVTAVFFHWLHTMNWSCMLWPEWSARHIKTGRKKTAQLSKKPTQNKDAVLLMMFCSRLCWSDDKFSGNILEY